MTGIGKNIYNAFAITLKCIKCAEDTRCLPSFGRSWAMNKYYNQKTTTSDGITHDSQKEAQRWCELKLLERAGHISNLRRQVEFELLPNQYETIERYGKNGKRLKDQVKLIEHKVSYIADFVYDENGKTVVEDVKSVATQTDKFIIKRKLMLYIHGIKIRIV
jgi:hypothetical protein